MSDPAPIDRPSPRPPAAWPSAHDPVARVGLLAVALPLLLAPSVSPTTTFLNQWVAFVGACVWSAWAARVPAPRHAPPGGGVAGLLAALLVLALAQCVGDAPWGQRAVPMASLLLAALLAHQAAAAAQTGAIGHYWRPLMLGLLLAGLGSVVVAAVQMFWPSGADGVWVAYPGALGRPIGNIRQPNQLSTLLVWAAAAAVWLAVQDRWSRLALAAVLLPLTLSVAATASRTGTLGVLLLGLWGLADRRLPGSARVLLLATLPAYAAGWWALEWWADQTGTAFYGDDQLRKTLHGDASSSRGRIWSNTLALIAAHPWTGVGPGAFNFHWSMTAFADRPVAFFDHSHNLVLQLAVESGLPLAVLVLVLLAWALWRARASLTDADVAKVRRSRVALFMLLLVGAHSLLEYPLWYLYFLLPAAVMAGTLVGAGCSADAGAPSDAPGPAGWLPAPLLPPTVAAQVVPGLAALGLVGALWALVDYHRVAVIFEPGLSLGPAEALDRRIRAGQRSVLFGHHADYAAVTVPSEPPAPLETFRRPLYHLLDTRLMTAYARALQARGDTERALHVAARLREFRNPQSEAFFAPCRGEAPPTFPCGPDPALPATRLEP